MVSDVARSVAESTTSGANVLGPILDSVRANASPADVAVITKAYAVADMVHQGQWRKSGDPYISHPLAVATILAELGMPATTLAAALLHDTVDGRSYSLPQLRRDFGEEIAGLVDGFSKLDLSTYGEEEHGEAVRVMMTAMARDVRVLVIKLADRLDNARTWCFVSEETARQKAHETLEIYAPLAHRLGLKTVMLELEQRCLAALYPAVNDEILHLFALTMDSRDMLDAGDGQRPVRQSEASLVPCGLTARELEVLALAGAGLTNYQIGRRLGVTERTARKHMGAVYAKTGLSGRAAAAAWWERWRQEGGTEPLGQAKPESHRT